MKKGVLLFLSVLMCFGPAACADQKTTPPVSEQNSQQEQSDIQTSTEISENHSVNLQEPTSSSSNAETSKTPETGERKVKLTMDGQEFDVTLYDTPTPEGEPEEFDPDVGDLCLYAPWGNLSIFYKDFRNSNGLISLGHIDSGMDIISGMNENFSVLLEKAE